MKIEVNSQFWCNRKRQSIRRVLPAVHGLAPVCNTGIAIFVHTMKQPMPRIVYHLLFWIIYYSAYAFFIVYNAYQVRDPFFYLQLMLFFPFDILLVYFNLYVLMPVLLKKKKYLWYGLAILAGIFIAACVEWLIKNMYVHMGYKLFAFTAGWNIANISAAMGSRFYLLGLTTGIKLAKDWVENQQRQQEREKHYLETELNFLKTQIHPHFFFNTLNNLYSLSLNNSSQAPAVILKLADLMSYMLYESSTEKISLDKEINFLHNFLDLEKLRFGERLSVSFEIEGQIENVSVPPMILILFVENCFKHGLKNNIANVSIAISLRVEKSLLWFSIKNPVSEHEATGAITTGIGLKNVKRRLDLLFGENYDLHIANDGKEYCVSLKMPV